MLRMTKPISHYLKSAFSLVPYLLTFSTYGSYLPVDCRGSTDRHIGWREAEPCLEDHARKTMIEPAFQLSRHQDRRAVRDAVVELCTQKGWWLTALFINTTKVRTTHLHLVVDADVAPERILQACKAYATRSLKGMHEVPKDKYWTRSGEIRRLHAGRALASAIHYVLNGQGTQMEVYAGDDRAQDPPIS